MTTELYKFQIKVIDILKRKFQIEGIVNLVGTSLSGRTTIIENFQLNGYEKHVITGRIDNKFEDLELFRKSSLYSKLRKIKGPLKEVASIVTSFLGQESFIEGIDGLVGLIQTPDITYLLERLNKGRILLVIDNIELVDQMSITFIEYIMSSVINKKMPNLKILLVMNSLEHKTAFRESSYHSVLIEDLTDEDYYTLNLTEPANFKGVPIGIIREFVANQEERSINDFRKNDFEKKYSLIVNDTDKKLILKTILLYGEIAENRWIKLDNVQGYLLQNHTYDVQFNLDSLIKVDFIEMSNNKQYVSLHNKYLEYITKELRNISDNDRTFIYLDFLERNAPFMYYEKYLSYVHIGNIDLALKNAMLAYSQLMREQGITSTTNQLLRFIESTGSFEIKEILEQVFTQFVHHNYQNAFHIVDSFIENLQGNYYAFSVEFIAELSYIRALSLARSINRKTTGDRHIFEADITHLEKILGSLNDINIDLSTRLQEAILVLSNDILDSNKVNERESPTKIFDQLYKIYQKKISETSPKYVEFWQIRLAVLLSKIEMVQSEHTQDLIPVLQRSYLILEQYKHKYPKNYLGIACNYSGANYWKDPFNNALQVLEKAIAFIEEKDLTPNWGVIYQMDTMLRIIRNKGDESAVNFYTSEVWEVEWIRNKMHEQYICISNYSIFLLSTSTIENINKAIEYLELSLQNSPDDPYDMYLLKTNLGVAKYLNGERTIALEIENECLTLIDGGEIKYFDNRLLKVRNRLLQNLYQNQSEQLHVLDVLNLNEIIDCKQCVDNYLRLGLFSDISYWAD
ncbi:MULTISPECIES: hypothetical protein [unclassified Paenibacillus]|uniref:hypothetical protein n=2 Tax=Paenibacillus TaxID=44249 RepID=UPI0004F657EA|nr:MULTISPECIES: hypothetical protein [unclassified Paenibacillus]AIQ29205.1 hypothetical protein P40081_14320 [Paenibacillus sp. FSL P4-0081]OMF23911.1 hypothetical protein BK132_24995 [Paenibacillus sp. FSL H8-0259]